MSTTYRVKVLVEQKRESVTIAPDGRFLISVDEKREGGKANERCIMLLAAFLCVSDEDISIVRGHMQPTKTLILRHTSG